MDTATPGMTCTRMQLTTLILISLAQYGVLGAPLGAMESSVAQDGLLPPLGAPRTFELFYPELPTLRPAEETSTAVPVIHLPEDDGIKNMEKAAADAYLDMFPQDLLDSNKKVRPINIRIIEHDGFIDYEIEFVELAEEQHNEYDSDTVKGTGHDNKDATDKPKNDFTNIEVTTQKIATTVPVSTSTGVTAVTFVDLLRRARRRHRQKVSQEKQNNRATTEQQGTTSFNLVTTESSFNVKAEDAPDISITRTSSGINLSEEPKTKFQRRNRVRNENKAGLAGTRSLVKQRKRISQQLVPQNVGNAAPIKMFQLAQRFTKTGRSTTFKPAMLTESSTSSYPNTEKEKELEDSHPNNNVKDLAHTHIVAATPIYEILSSTSMPSYQESPRSTQDNKELISDNLLQVDDSSRKRPTENISGVKDTKIASKDIHQTSEKPMHEITTTLSLIEELKRQLITISYDLSQEQSTEYKTPTTTQTSGGDHAIYELEDLQSSESRAVVDLHTSEETSTVASMKLVQSERPEVLLEENDAETTMMMTDLEDMTELPDDIQFFTQAVMDYETMQSVTSEITTEAQYSQPERSPKRINSKGALSQIIEDSTTFEGLKESQTVTPVEVIKGRYHEMNPGQYHEINPGQYHEVNPGQYHESNPGQYHEKHPGQDLGVENVTVDFDHGDESRIYNVQANAGDFIIGEVGRIDINSGQTFQGVRYTAVEGEVDQAQISDLLERYFGARTS